MRKFTVLLFLAMTLGMAPRAGAKDNTTFDKLAVFSKVLSYVESNYVGDVKTNELIDQAIKGMLSELDPHTMYMPPEMYREMRVGTKGEFGGLGLEVGMKDDQLTVISPIEDTPADKAGIKPGDKITKIDGTSTKGMSLTEAVNRMRGSNGTKVDLTLQRGTEPEFQVSLKRQTIQLKSVSSELVDDFYGYVRLKSFQEKTGQDLAKHLDQLEKKAKGGLKGVVLDLRNNPGGLLDQAVRVADEFLDTGSIVSTIGRKGAFQEVKMAHKEGTRPSYPLITLVNEGSASASEIVAGALQDHGRSVILGTQTFGKGSVQTIIDLEDGSGLKLTIAQYYTPKGRSIQAEGIKPDIVVSADQAESTGTPKLIREKDLKGHLETAPKAEPAVAKEPKKPSEVDIEHDPQLRRAVEYLKTWEVFRTTISAG